VSVAVPVTEVLVVGRVIDLSVPAEMTGRLFAHIVPFQVQPEAKAVVTVAVARRTELL